MNLWPVVYIQLCIHNVFSSASSHQLTGSAHRMWGESAGKQGAGNRREIKRFGRRWMASVSAPALYRGQQSTTGTQWGGLKQICVCVLWQIFIFDLMCKGERGRVGIPSNSYFTAHTLMRCSHAICQKKLNV